MKKIAIHGRQPEFGIAELEMLIGYENIEPIGNVASLVSEASDIEYARFGSSVKFAELVATMSLADLKDVVLECKSHLLEYAKSIDGKLKLGVSVYGLNVKPKEVERASLEIKSYLKANGVSVRVVPNKKQQLNAASVLNNKLTKQNGYELIIVYGTKSVYVGRCIYVQDIDEYARRDRDKPKRDPLNGMLPPKLAQTLINLASPEKDFVVLDPFCGSGTVLMEAAAMGMGSYGTDISPIMVHDSRENLEWFSKGREDSPAFVVEEADACDYKWSRKYDFVACETFLGPAIKESPEKDVLNSIIAEVNDIHVKFLSNLATQTKTGFKLAIAVPAWRKNGDIYNLPLLDDLEELGYNSTSFKHVSNELVYFRPQQNVARRVLVLQRK